jgi:hypothetical protein
MKTYVVMLSRRLVHTASKNKTRPSEDAEQPSEMGSVPQRSRELGTIQRCASIAG